MIIFLLVATLMGSGFSQTSDLIKQADGVFTKLNSNGTEKLVTNVFENIEEIIDRVNSQSTQERTNEIFNNLNEILKTINSNETKEIIHNLRLLSQNSKVYIDVSDSNWQLNQTLIMWQVFLGLLIGITMVLFFTCIYRFLKKKPEEEFSFYNPLLANNDIEILQAPENRL